MKKQSFLSVLIIAILFAISGYAQDSVYHRAKIWEKAMHRFAESDKKVFPQPGSILFVGSSSFTMWENMQASFPSHRVINRGFGGSILADVIYYAQQIVFPYKPAQIVLYEGDNDIADGASATEYLDDVKTFVRLVEIHLPGVPILIVSTKNSPSREKYASEYDKANALVFDFARTKKHVQFVDVNTLLRDSQGNYIKSYFKDDMLHLNEKGYAVWARQIEPYLIQTK